MQTLEQELTDVLPEVEPIFRRVEGGFDFTHKAFREVLTASRFARRINSGELDVRDAYENMWSYQEDVKLWGVEGRALLPDWKPILLHMVSMLHDDKAEELVEVVSEGFFETREKFRLIEYNPYEQERDFAVSLVAANDFLRSNQNEFVDRLLAMYLDEGVWSASEYLILTKSRYIAQKLFKVFLEFNSDFSIGSLGTLDQKGKSGIYTSKDGGLYRGGLFIYCPGGDISESIQKAYLEDLVGILMGIGDADINTRLIQYLGDNSGLDMIGVRDLSQGLAESPVAKITAVSYLEHYMDNHSNPERKRALVLFTKLEGKKSIGVLSTYLLDSEAEVRKAAAEGLAGTGDPSVAPILRDYYLQNRQGGFPGLHDFSKIKHPLVVETLLELIQDVNHHRMRSMIYWTKQLKDSRILPTLLSLYPQLDGHDEREELLKAFGDLGDKAAVPFLMETLGKLAHTYDNSLLDKAILVSLGQIGDPVALEPLLEYAFGSYHWPIRNAASAIERIGVEPVLGSIKDKLLNGSQREKERAVEMLTYIKADESFLDLLYPFLDSPNKQLCAKAADAIGRIDSREAVPVLERKLKEPGSVYAIAHALSAINGPSSIKALGEYTLSFDFPEWKKQNEMDTHNRVLYLESGGRFFLSPMRVSGVVALKKMNDPKTIPYLMEYFGECPCYEKMSAAEGLVEFGHAPIVPLLRDSYTFRKGLGHYGDKSKEGMDVDITKKLRNIHQRLKPKGYKAPKAA